MIDVARASIARPALNTYARSAKPIGVSAKRARSVSRRSHEIKARVPFLKGRRFPGCRAACRRAFSRADCGRPIGGAGERAHLNALFDAAHPICAPAVIVACGRGK